LESVELTQQSAERYPHEFSGGQRQRISIARALATQPRLLVCDEPTSALDADVRHSFLELLFGECKKAGSTLLFVSHDSNLSELFNRKISIDELNNIRN